MTARLAIACGVLAACGDNLAAVDASQDLGCTAAFSDNFTETAAGPASCATVEVVDAGETAWLKRLNAEHLAWLARCSGSAAQAAIRLVPGCHVLPARCCRVATGVRPEHTAGPTQAAN